MKHNEISLDEMLKAIDKHPYLSACFSDYLEWLFEKCDEDRRKYDPAFMRISNLQHDLNDLESAFGEASKILSLNEAEFCQAFKFNIDRNKNEILTMII